jgi:hypothetical protein
MQIGVQFNVFSSKNSNEFKLLTKYLNIDSILSVEELNGGINSGVKKLILNDGSKFILKTFKKDDARNRLKSELNAINYITKINAKLVPKVVGYDEANLIALYHFIDGIPNPRLDQNLIKQFIDFQILLDRNKNLSIASDIDNAAECSLSSVSLIQQLENRLLEIKNSDYQYSALDDFLQHELIPFFEHLKSRVLLLHSKSLPYSFEENIPKSWQTLIPSDFSAHNTILMEHKSLVFVDFEYFGWDDPIASIANFIFHPAMNNYDKVSHCFESKLCSYFSSFPWFEERYDVLKPIFGFRWCLIILNCFNSFRNSGRLHSEQFLQQQLAKSKLLFRKINKI